MDYVTLGKTGLRTSVIGLGAGGHSRLGQQTGNTEAESVAVVHRALDLGINFFDTAEAYGTESIIGKGLQNVPRDQVILSTKKGVYQDGEPVSASTFVADVDACLQRLGTDYVDIFHLHGVRRHQYEHAINQIVPALLKLKESGKIRFLGLTESFSQDPGHEMFQRALEDDCWDVMMVGFNILNQTARDLIFPQTIERNIGVLAMFVVRRAFSQPQRLREILAELIEAGTLDPDRIDLDDPLAFLVHEGGAHSLADAAYRYARYEPGIHTVLSGTGKVAHLEENVQSLLRPALPAADVQRLNALFAQVDTVSGN